MFNVAVVLVFFFVSFFFFPFLFRLKDSFVRRYLAAPYESDQIDFNVLFLLLLRFPCSAKENYVYYLDEVDIPTKKLFSKWRRLSFTVRPFCINGVKALPVILVMLFPRFP